MVYLLELFLGLQSHSNRCTESFMRENVVEELRQLRTDDRTKRKTLDILKRFHSEEEMEDLDEDGMWSQSLIHHYYFFVARTSCLLADF